MCKSTVFKFLGPSLMLLLSACGGAQAASDEAGAPNVKFVQVEEVQPAVEPIVEEPAAVVEEEAVDVTVAQPVTEPVVEAAQADSPVEETAEMAETTTDEMVVEEEAPEAMADEAMNEAVTVEEAALTESPADEEETMVEEMMDEAAIEAVELSPEQQALLDQLTVLGQPPELFNEVWLNSEPLKLANLHGKVVIVEFWTFG